METPLIQAIEDRLLDLPTSLKAVADFLLVEGSGIEALSMAELARATYTSKPTLVRFAKQFGLSGWPEFRAAFIREARASEARAASEAMVDVNYPFGPDEPPASAAQKAIRVHELAAKHVSEGLSDELLASAAAAIDASPQVVFFGRPPSCYYGASFAFKLNTLGKSCLAPHAEEADFVQALFQEGNLAIFASYSGTLEKEPFCFLDDLRRRGTTVLAVTSEGSPLALAADLALTYAPIERYYNKVASFYSCACTELLLDSLFSAYYLRHYADYAAARATLSGRVAPLTQISDDLSPVS